MTHVNQTPDDESTHESENANIAPTISSALLAELVCPLTKTALIYDEAAQELVSKQAKLAFPIRDGIPIMLVEEARQLG